MELRDGGLNMESQVPVKVHYKGHIVGDSKADIIVDNQMLLELKAARSVGSVYEAPVLNYLRATVIAVGLILKFEPKPQVKRYVYDHPRKKLFLIF